MKAYQIGAYKNSLMYNHLYWCKTIAEQEAAKLNEDHYSEYIRGREHGEVVFKPIQLSVIEVKIK